MGAWGATPAPTQYLGELCSSKTPMVGTTPEPTQSGVVMLYYHIIVKVVDILKMKKRVIKLDGLEICQKAVDSTQSKTWLNDVMVDLYIKYLSSWPVNSPPTSGPMGMQRTATYQFMHML
jgi:hypothetical protein